MATVNVNFGKSLKKFGANDYNACYNCGNCTAVCDLSTEDTSFPREMVRYSSLGLKDELKSSLKPWECYYCGACNTHCPQEANPGELMMSLRRWLTSQYDWTGLSGLFYKSTFASVLAMVLVAIGVVAYGVYIDFDMKEMIHTGHIFEQLAILIVSFTILLPNVIRMWYFSIKKTKIKAKPKIYFQALNEFFATMFVQKKAKECEDNNLRWLEHLILVFAYLSLLFTTVFLNWFGTENIIIIVLGYTESFLVFVITIHFVSERIKKSRALAKFSQPSDWLFVIWLLLMGLTAFIVRLTIDLNLNSALPILYTIHLSVLAQWALLIVPFGKWTHFIYRSFATYFAKIKTMAK